MKGQVVKVIAGFYDIYANKKYYRVRGSGKLRNNEESPVVGDFVEFNENGTLQSIYERKNILIRPKVANIDQIVIITSIKEPEYNSLLLNKLLSVIEFNNIKPILVFSKEDLSNESPIQEYINMQYESFSINNNEPSTLNQLDNIFENKLTVFTGQTGAGKSSTISNLTNIELETQEISKALGRGKHTTRVVEIIPWHKGWLIDTPGFSSFEVPLTKLELSKSFSIFKKHMDKCKFRNCAHIKEEICGIKMAVDNNIISQTRYNDYKKLYEGAKNE